MSAGRMYWADLETTGLDVTSDVIVQVGIAVTDADLNLVVQREWYLWSPTIERKYHQLAFIDEEFPKDDRAWAYRQHHLTGLWDQCKKEGIMPAQASAEITEFLDDEFLAPSDPMCGSSVHFDRAFLKTHMPRVEKMFGYRNIDVSTLKELAKRWNPKIVPTSSQHQPVHLAQNDLLNTLDEARLYRDEFLKTSSESLMG